MDFASLNASRRDFIHLLHRRSIYAGGSQGGSSSHRFSHPHSRAMAMDRGAEARAKAGAQEEGRTAGPSSDGPSSDVLDVPLPLEEGADQSSSSSSSFQASPQVFLRVASWRTQEQEAMVRRARLEEAHAAKREQVEARLRKQRKKDEQVEARLRKQRKKDKEARRKQMEKKARDKAAAKADAAKRKAVMHKRQLRKEFFERQLKEMGIAAEDEGRTPRSPALRTRSGQDRLIRKTADAVVRNLDGDHELLARVGANLLSREIDVVDEPEYLQCPIMLSLFKDPVCAPSGYTYERTAILEHLSHSGTDPMTRQPLQKEQLLPNLCMRQAVQAHARLFPDAGQI